MHSEKVVFQNALDESIVSMNNSSILIGVQENSQKEQLDQLSAENFQLRQQNLELNQRLSGLQDQLVGGHQKVFNNVENDKNELKRIETAERQQQDDMSKLRKAVENFQQIIEGHSKQLQTNNLEASQYASDSEAAKQRLALREKELIDLRSELENSQHKVRDIESNYINQQEKMSNIVRQSRKLQEQRDQQKEELAQLRSELAIAQETRHQIEGLLNDQKRENIEQVRQIQDLKRQIDDLRAHLEEVERRDQNLLQQSKIQRDEAELKFEEEAKRLESEVEFQRQLLESHKNDSRTQRERDIRKHEEELSELQAKSLQERITLQRENAQLTIECQKLKKKLQENGASADLSSSMLMNSSIGGSSNFPDNSVIQQRNRDQEEQIVQLHARIRELHSEIEKKSIMLDAREFQEQDLNEAIKRLKQENQSYQEIFDKIDAKFCIDNFMQRCEHQIAENQMQKKAQGNQQQEMQKIFIAESELMINQLKTHLQNKGITLKFELQQ